MNDLHFQIDIVLNECSRSLSVIKKEEECNDSFYKNVFRKFTNGSLLQFVKHIQEFFKTSECKNIYMLCVCLSQIRKCLLMFDTIVLEQDNVLSFEKVLCSYLLKRIQKCFYKLEDYLEVLYSIDEDEHPGIFIDRMDIVLNGLNNRDNLELIKPNIDKILFQAVTIAIVSDETDNLEITSSSKHVLKALQQFENMNIDDVDSFFQLDYLSSSLSILERRINITILHLFSKTFNDPFYTIKKLLRKCVNSNNFQLRKPSDLSSMISDLDKSTDILIQIGLFSVACCKNNGYVIPLKSCISSLELLDSDMVPAIIEFYLDPNSLIKKKFLKLLINHWVAEICEIQNLLNRIVDPLAFSQTTLETSMNIINTICKSDSTTNIDLYDKLLNGLTNLTKYIEKIFTNEVSKENAVSTSYKQFKDALKELKACFIFNKKSNHDINDKSTRKKLHKRCEIVMKYLNDVQVSISNIMVNKSYLPESENTNYILSKTKQSSMSLLQNDEPDNNNDLNLLFSTIHNQKSFYNKSERKNSKLLYHQDTFLSGMNESIKFENTVTMDLTNLLDNFIETLHMDNDDKTTVNFWEEISIDTPTRVQDLEDAVNKIKNVVKVL